MQSPTLSILPHLDFQLPAAKLYQKIRRTQRRQLQGGKAARSDGIERHKYNEVCAWWWNQRLDNQLDLVLVTPRTGYHHRGPRRGPNVVFFHKTCRVYVSPRDHPRRSKLLIWSMVTSCHFLNRISMVHFWLFLSVRFCDFQCWRHAQWHLFSEDIFQGDASHVLLIVHSPQLMVIGHWYLDLFRIFPLFTWSQRLWLVIAEAN